MGTETRRDFLGLVALGMGVASCRLAMAQPAERAVYVGAETASVDGLSRASFFSAGGERLSSLPLDFRAHGMATHGARLVVFPRRPGNRFAVIDEAHLEVLSVVTAPQDRHFFGHGAFTLDGRHLLVTENNLESLTGTIGVYSADGWQREGEVALPGPGPHEIARHPRRDLFHIALGGLETHPDYGRNPLNLHAFRSQIVTLDFSSGRVEPLGFWAGTEGISLRHLAMDGLGRLYVGGQIKAADRAVSEDVIWIVEDEQITQPALSGSMKGYVSSVAAHGSQALIASKESGLCLRLDGNKLLEQTAIEGASAVAIGTGLTIASGFTMLNLNDQSLSALQGHEFDNHGLLL